MLFNNKIKVRFTQSFTCTDFGNVYEGMVRTYPKNVLNKYLEAGVCEVVQDEKVETPKQEEVKNESDKPKRRKKSLKGGK